MFWKKPPVQKSDILKEAEADLLAATEELVRAKIKLEKSMRARDFLDEFLATNGNGQNGTH